MKEANETYHSWLKKILSKFSEENKVKFQKYNKTIKLTSNKRHAKNIIEYEPDYVFKLKTGKKSFEFIVFEFLDSQSYEGSKK